MTSAEQASQLLRNEDGRVQIKSEEEETCAASAIPKSKKSEEKKVVSHLSAIILGPKCISKVADRSKRQGHNQ